MSDGDTADQSSCRDACCAFSARLCDAPIACRLRQRSRPLRWQTRRQQQQRQLQPSRLLHRRQQQQLSRRR